MKLPIKVGMGYDVHQLAADRPLILGGVAIPYDRGLLGHSDADVLLHAVADSLLGAAGLGDIGIHFPNTDEKYRDYPSTKLLNEVFRMIAGEGFRVGNVDAVVIAEQPQLAPHIPVMRGNIAHILGVSEGNISIKATTNERMGFVGREEGIAALATSLIYRNDGTFITSD